MSSSKPSKLLSAIVFVNIRRKTHKQLLIDVKYNLGPFCLLKDALETLQRVKKVTEMWASRSIENIAIIAMQRS